MSVEICFDGYLRSVVSAYQQWWRLYTLTDATGRESQRVERDRPAFFDFGLMVQTVDKEKVESQKEKGEEEKKEKIERLPVLEGICKYATEHVLLVGRPGSGKSTALARLLLQEAEIALSDRNAKIPVLVELRYLPSEANESSVCDHIVAFMHKHDPALDIDEAGIKQLLRQGRLLLLVDGVNELPSDRGRVMVNQFRELYQKTCPMIFTTRELSAGGDLGIAKRLEMQPLTEPQMQQFVMAYLPTQGERLLRQLSGRLREFGQTPLLLWMLCSLFQQSEQIPPNLGMVFRAFTVGYGDRIKQDVTLSKDSRAWWGRLLQYLAFKMTCGESLTELQVAISRREAEQFLVEFLRGKVEFADDCAVRWLEDLLKHHLIQISNDRIEFRHQLIQEYYAAEWLLGLLPSLSDARLQQGYLNYLKWTESLALMLALVEGEEQAVRVVRLALEVDLRLGARLAGAVTYGFQEKTVGLLIQEIDERKIPKLYAIELLGGTRSDYAIHHLSQALKDSDYFVRKTAAEVLGKIGSDKAVEPLIIAFKDSNYFVRKTAAEVLGNIGSDRAVEPLIIALKDSNDDVRKTAEEVLGNIDSDKAVEPLIIALKDSNYFVRKTAAEVLGKIGSDKAVEPLIIALKDSNDDVRKIAADALGKIGSGKAVEPLIIALKDSNDDVRKIAAEVLGKIGSDKAVEPLIIALKDSNDRVRKKAAEVLGKIGSGKAVEPLIIALKDSDHVVRRIAAEALGKIGSDKAVEPLILAFKYSEYNSYYDVSREAKAALGKIGSDKAVKLLILALKDSDHVVRRIAAEVLGNIGSDKAVEPLILALKDSNDRVRWKAAEALGSGKDVETFILALKDSNDDVRQTAADVLGYIDSDKAVEPLILALKDSNDLVRRKAAEALGYIGSDKIVKYLILALKDSNDDERREAADALGNAQAVKSLIFALKDSDKYVRKTAAELLSIIGIDTVVKPLILALKDSTSSYERKTAADALGKIGSDKVVEPLILALKDSNHDVRETAAVALGKIGSDKAVESLILALKDSNHDVRWIAAVALGKIGSDKAVEPLILALKDSNHDVRETAAKVLGKIGSDKAVESLILALKDSNHDVRWIAAVALGRVNITNKVNIVTFALLEVLETDDFYQCQKAVEILGKIGGKMAVRGLIPLLQDNDFLVRQSAAKALGEIAYPILIDYLYKLIPTTYGLHEIPFVITAIQARCKYYNYAIYNTALQETENYANPVEKILQEIHQTLKTMSETGKYNVKAEVFQIVENNYGQVIGKNSGQAIGKNYANDPVLLQTINEITQVLANLQKTHPTATEAEAKDIIEAEFKEIQNNQPNRWTTFRQQLLNPERWLNGGKATISEIAKHYAENSVFLKAGVAFLDGFSADEE